MFGKNQEKNVNVDLEIFTIYDSKSKTYDKPIFCPNKDVLMREFLNMYNNPAEAKNILRVNAEDFSIFRIGTFDKRTGNITAQNCEHVVNLHDLRALSEPTLDVLDSPEKQHRALLAT